MNFDAPRLLAHSFLFELDRYVEDGSRGAYARFMDDIDVGVSSIGEAKRLLRDMDLVLQARGVRLNAGKTRIMSGEEAHEHFFVRDNMILDLIDHRLEVKSKAARAAGTPFNPYRERNYLVGKFIRDVARPGYFDQGNGEKILKRYIGFSVKYGIAIQDSYLRSFIFTRPSLREYAIRAVCFKGYSIGRFEILSSYILSDYCVDDASLFFVAKAIVDMACPGGRPFRTQINSLVNSLLGMKNDVAFVSALWLLSKFGAAKQLLDVLVAKQDAWFGSDWLGRQVGALYPRFIKRPEFQAYLDLIRRSRNGGAQATFGLHQRLVSRGINAAAIFHYLKSATPSQPRKLTHSKILLLISFQQSAASASQKIALSAVYKGWPLDFPERRLLRRLI